MLPAPEPTPTSARLRTGTPALVANRPRLMRPRLLTSFARKTPPALLAFVALLASGAACATNGGSGDTTSAAQSSAAAPATPASAGVGQPNVLTVEETAAESNRPPVISTVAGCPCSHSSASQARAITSRSRASAISGVSLMATP